MAAGFIKLDKPIDLVKAEVEARFTIVQYNELICDEVALPRRYKINCIFLYATAGVKKFNYVKQTRHNASKFRQNEVSNYDRFIVLGVEGTQHVLLMFTSSSEETRRLLTYNKFISPGTAITLLCPKVIGYLKNTQNPLVKTGDPLVPSLRGNILKPPPADVSLGNYVFFDFLATNLRIVQAVPKDNVCMGKLCDAQGTATNCCCISAPPQKHWALTLSIKCDELAEKVTGEDAIIMTSTQSTKIFIATVKRSEQLCNDNIDTYEMDEAVADLAESVDKNQKFRVIGWFKPAQDEDGVAAGNFAYHVCYIEPSTPLDAIQQSMMYGAVNDRALSDVISPRTDFSAAPQEPTSSRAEFSAAPQEPSPFYAASNSFIGAFSPQLPADETPFASLPPMLGFDSEEED